MSLTHRHCPDCGSPCEARIPEDDHRPRAVCTACANIHYVNPKVVVGCIVEKEGELLLARRNIEPARGRWTFPAGYLETGESSFDGAARETMEETEARTRMLGLHAVLDIPHIGQVYTVFRAEMEGEHFAPTPESTEVVLVDPDRIPWTSSPSPASPRHCACGTRIGGRGATVSTRAPSSGAVRARGSTSLDTASRTTSRTDVHGDPTGLQSAESVEAAAEGGYEVEWLGAPPEARVEVLEESARSIITRNDSPDVPFSFGVNAYRGCQHACAYCYARPGHQHLGFGAGTDFDTKIVVKTNAEELLRAELARGRTGPAGRRDWIAMSGVTDPYQPLEASFALTRRLLEACLEFRQPVGLITKSALVRRDAELLGRLARAAGARVFLSIPFASEEDARALEPWAPSPRLRFEALAALREQGVPTGVSLSPMIPGLNDHAIPEILQRAAGGRRDPCVHDPAQAARRGRACLREAPPRRLPRSGRSRARPARTVPPGPVVQGRIRLTHGRQRPALAGGGGRLHPVVSAPRARGRRGGASGAVESRVPRTALTHPARALRRLIARDELRAGPARGRRGP